MTNVSKLIVTELFKVPKYVFQLFTQIYILFEDFFTADCGNNFTYYILLGTFTRINFDELQRMNTLNEHFDVIKQLIFYGPNL